MYNTVYFFQIAKWKLLDESFTLQPNDWGWEWKNNVLMPVMTDLEIGPENFLKVVRCNCKATSKNQCGTKIRSCRKHGILCSAICGDCQGQCCLNSQEVR